MKKSFTMIELIFVIVILGILAAVAIPKLAATRDDADIAGKVSKIASVQNEIVSHVFSQVAVDTNLTNMSQTLRIMVEQGQAEEGIRHATFLVSGFKCVDMNISTDDQNLTINFRDPGSNIVCQGIQKALSQTTTEMVISGATVTY
jgi:general secretion pathway protein G